MSDPQPPPDLALSPSIVHRRLMAGTEPRLAYAGGDVGPWQERLRAKLRDLLRPPDSEGWPLDVRVLWRRDHPLGTIEKIAFRCEPGSDAVAYWCVPASAEPPYTTFICLQGHSTGMHNSIAVDQANETDPIDVPGDRDFGLGCMERGLAALCLEQRAFGERGEKRQDPVCEYNPCLDTAVHALMLRRTLLGERVLDVDRAIDVLAERGDVDMDRLGVMGNSGGGTTTMYAAALLPRVRAIVPSCCVARFADSLMSLYHCACNFVPDLLHWADMADVVGCFAPRPCVVVSGEHDEIFPIESARASADRIREIYRAAGTEEDFAHVVGDEGHRFYADLAWDAMLPMLGR